MANVYEAGKNKLDHEIQSTIGYVPDDWKRKEHPGQVGWYHRKTKQYVNIVHDRAVNMYPFVTARILKKNLYVNKRIRRIIVPVSANHDYQVFLEYLREKDKRYWIIKTLPEHFEFFMRALVDDLVSAIYEDIL